MFGKLLVLPCYSGATCDAIGAGITAGSRMPTFSRNEVGDQCFAQRRRIDHASSLQDGGLSLQTLPFGIDKQLRKNRNRLKRNISAPYNFADFSCQLIK